MLMMAPYARLSTLVTAYCSVKPTAAIARIAAFTMPNPTYWRNRLIQLFSGHTGRLACLSPGQPGQLTAANDPGGARTARRGVANRAERLAVVVPLVESDRPARADIANGLAPGQRRPSLGEGVDQDLAWPGLGDVLDGGVVDRRHNGMGLQHGQRHDDRAVIVGHRVRVDGPLRGLLYLLSVAQQRVLEHRVGASLGRGVGLKRHVV